jgi:hypothetical protein
VESVSRGLGDFITYCNGNMKVIIGFAIMSIERNGPMALAWRVQSILTPSLPRWATRNAEAGQAVR